MKIGKRSEKMGRMTNPNKNQSKKNMMLIGVIVVTVLLIMWVYVMGKKQKILYL